MGCIKLYWYEISSSLNMKEGTQIDSLPPEKLPSKSPALLGLTKTKSKKQKNARLFSVNANRWNTPSPY